MRSRVKQTLRTLPASIFDKLNPMEKTTVNDSDAKKRSLLIVGLRNPGKGYSESRHNAGAMALSLLAKRHGISITQEQKRAITARGTINGADVRFILPQTYMNASGEAVRPLVRRTGTRLENLLIVYDDMDLPVGRIRIRPYGSAGGHNGMKSIIAALGSDQFPRLRIGIGRPDQKGRGAIDFVLGRFRSDERGLLDEALNRAADCMETFAGEGIERAMNVFN